jgi:hypothetical protein
MSERAVSDVLGFILVFSFISLTVGIVSLTGFAGLDERQDAEQVNNAERAFEILADNVEDIYRRGAPRRSTEVALAGAQLSSAETARVEVAIGNLEQPPNVKVLNPIKYSGPDGTTLSYENGAVIRQDPNGAAVMRHEPNLVFSNRSGNEIAILPIVSTSGATSIGGETTALIRTEGAGSAVLDRYDDRDTRYEVRLRITTSPERAMVWWRYLNEDIEAGYGTANTCGNSPPASDTVICDFSVDQVSITSTRIDVEFA